MSPTTRYSNLNTQFGRTVSCSTPLQFSIDSTLRGVRISVSDLS